MSHPTDGIYKKDGLGYIAVSNILGKTLPLFNPSKTDGLEYWRRTEPNAIEILERGQRRGTIIHGEVELNLSGKNDVHGSDRPSYEEIVSFNIHEYVTYLSPLLEEIKGQNPCSTLCNFEEEGKCMTSGNSCDNLSKSLLIEEKIFCPHGWAGTPDLRLWWDGSYTIWDWKSVRSYKEDGVAKKAKSMSYYKEAFVQIGAYALAHNIRAKSNPWLAPITQGAICVCYDWREPHVHVLSKDELKDAANTFIERYKVFQSLEDTIYPIKL